MLGGNGTSRQHW